jgi:hypothetical protein
VRSAIVNTADRGVVKALDHKSTVTDANKVGTGRENVLSAVSARVALDPVSISFGAVPSGSGATLQSAVTLTNTSGAPQSYTLKVVEPAGAGVSYSVPATAITVGATESATVVVTQVAQRGAAAGPKQAVLQVSAGGNVIANAMLYTLVK